MADLWGIRTVRHGRVKLGHKWWKPKEHHMVYDGRLDGQRFSFHKYPGEDLVNLWGTEASVEGLKEGLEPTVGPECVDGYLPWVFWQLAEAP